MTDNEDKSFRLDPAAKSFRPSDFGVRDLPLILVTIGLVTLIAFGLSFLTALISPEFRIFIGGLAAGLMLSSGVAHWRVKPRKQVPPRPLSEKVKSLARDPNRKIEAIKVYREETGAGLAEAKEAVEDYVRQLQVPT
jgi:hypothetical protein